MKCMISSNGIEKCWECQNEHEHPYVQLKLILLQKLRELYNGGYTDFYINCERGVPLWTGEAICHLRQHDCAGIRLHIVIPYEEQCRNWPEDLRNRYYRVHELADSVTAANTQYEEDCYIRADLLMAENCDLIFFLGRAADSPHLVEFARKHDIKAEFADSQHFDVS